MYVCICKAVTDTMVLDALAEGACSVEQVAARTQAGTCCGACKLDVERLVRQHRAEKPEPVALPHKESA